jgi:hypothetical protein
VGPAANHCRPNAPPCAHGAAPSPRDCAQRQRHVAAQVPAPESSRSQTCRCWTSAKRSSPGWRPSLLMLGIQVRACGPPDSIVDSRRGNRPTSHAASPEGRGGLLSRLLFGHRAVIICGHRRSSMVVFDHRRRSTRSASGGTSHLMPARLVSRSFELLFSIVFPLRLDCFGIRDGRFFSLDHLNE